MVGAVLQDSFRLTGLIGRGGMGTVYEGTQLRLNKRVAIKLLSRDLASNEEALARFRREAEVTSQLGHPHIVHVFDFGTAPSGEPYLVMEYLEGEDLDLRIRRAGRLRLPIVANVVKQIASALAATHARGIVHRDLKPANIFLLEVEGETDFVKVVDFGISKVRAASLRITGESAIIGTPNYMSPEQALGQLEVDHKTDQWSLACIAYEMLAGRGPFVGETVHSLLYQVVHEEPPALGRLVPGLPDDVERTIRRAMEKSPADRFPTVVAFSRAFTAAIEGRTVAAVSNSPTPASSSIAPSRPREVPMRSGLATFSKTVLEIQSLARLRARLTPKGVAAAGVTAAVVLLAGVFALRSRSSQSPTAPPLPALTSSPPTAPPPRSSSPVVAPLPAPAPIPSPAPDVTTRPPPSETSATAKTAEKVEPPPRDQTKHKRGSSAHAGSATGGSASQPSPPASPPPKPSPSTPRPAKPHLIEEL
jgi:serine/threonine-protein kinase